MEMQNNKKQANYTMSWLLLSETAKMKVKENIGVDPDSGPSLDSELQLLASGALPEEKLH